MINKKIKLFALMALGAAALGIGYIRGERELPFPELHPEITSGRIIAYREETNGDDTILRFQIQYVTGEKTGHSRLRKQNGEIWGDGSYIGSVNVRIDPLPIEKSLEVCCEDGRLGVRCSIPRDNCYERCRIDVQRYEK